MKCILHIGTEKTGTTSFQKKMAAGRAQLRQMGVFYPESLGQVTHQRFAVTAMGADRPDDSFAALGVKDTAGYNRFCRRVETGFDDELRRNSAAQICVISSEHLHSRLTDPAQIRRVRRFLEARFDGIEIYVSLRPQIDLVVSLASTAVRAGYRVRRGFLTSVGPGTPYYDYQMLFDLWAEQFPVETIQVLPFRRHPDFGAYLFEKLGLDWAVPGPDLRENTALDIQTIALANALLDGGLRAALPWHRLDRLPCKQPLQPGAQLARTIQDRFTKSNQMFCAARTDIQAGDLEPDRARYTGTGNIAMLDQNCGFAVHLADFSDELLACQAR